MRKILLAGVLGLSLVAGTLSPAFAGGKPGEDPAAKSNSGRGNLSETTPETDCDPGKSGGKNQGGD